jgi:hypothetical protein
VAASGESSLFLPVDVTPSDAVRMVGQHLAGRLDGFAWRSSAAKLSRDHGGNREEISFQGSRHNRSGEPVEVWLYGRVGNKAVKAWRAANPGLSLLRDDTAYGGLAGNVLGTFEAGQFRFAPGDANTLEMERLTDFLVETVVPWLELAHDPDGFIAQAPAVSLEDATVAEWLLSVGRRDLVETLIRRVAGRAAWAAAFDSGRQKALQASAPVMPGSAEHWGWLAVVNGLDPI